VKRDFTARFTGSALGIFWAVLQPLSLVVLYWFVFTYLFSRGPGARDNDYIFFLISGLLPWLGMNEGVVRSTTSIVENAPMVRRLAFRSELLVVVPNASALIFEVIGLVLFLGFLLLRGATPHLIWLLPFALLLQFSLQVGLGWILAATYVIFRDLLPMLGFALSQNGPCSRPVIPFRVSRRACCARVTRATKLYLRDCYDHTVQLMDLVESYRDVLSGLMELYLSSVGIRTNEIMRVLTVISSIFIPLTFIVGIYGMNFAREVDGKKLPWNMPELYQPWGYVAVLLFMLGVAIFQIVYFKRRRWL